MSGDHGEMTGAASVTRHSKATTSVPRVSGQRWSARSTNVPLPRRPRAAATASALVVSVWPDADVSATSATRPRESNAGVQDRVQQIDNQVDEHERRRDQKDD